ncbi:hypothetical protein EG329_000135 [Mollisiaceae sp. DMI_Dod_QoI]|nr:hypothetical protein EG329_000135 [Helotiales sp. DMI_Dod_QoI]
MAFDLPHPEPYSAYTPWERKHAFKRGFPFSDPGHKFWCFKNKCNVIFSSLGRVAQHEKFAHSRHPISGDYGDWLERVENEEEDENVAKIKGIKETREDKTHRSMMRIGMDFFGRAALKEEL